MNELVFLPPFPYRPSGPPNYLGRFLVLCNRTPKFKKASQTRISHCPSGSLVFIQGLFFVSSLAVCLPPCIYTGSFLTSTAVLPILLPTMPLGFEKKRAATSPLSSEFDKKPKLGLTDEECIKLNKTQGYVELPTWKNPEDVKITSLALAFREVAIHAAIVSQSWVDTELCEKSINQLSRSEQLDLASVWINARDTKDWTGFANHRALRPFHRCAKIAAALYSFTSYRAFRVWQDSGIG
jgi:hypothetical protein